MKYIEYQKLRRAERRAWAVKLLGGKCRNCGYDKCLEFNHINPDEKEFNLSQAWSWSLDRLKKELAKCELLCTECHREETARWRAENPYKHHRQPRPEEHGTKLGYARGCRCRDCKTAHATYHRERRQKKYLLSAESLL